MSVQPIGPSNTKSPKFLKMAVGYFVDPVLGYVQYKTEKGAHNWQKVRA